MNGQFYQPDTVLKNQYILNAMVRDSLRPGFLVVRIEGGLPVADGSYRYTTGADTSKIWIAAGVNASAFETISSTSPGYAILTVQQGKYSLYVPPTLMVDLRTLKTASVEASLNSL